MIFDDVTIQDCHREAWLESQIKVAQRKIDRLCKQISFKEEIAQGLMSRWFCQHYDNQIGRRYEEMAQLEGAVRAAQLELDRLADKRYADKARRLATLALIEEVGKKATAGTTPASAPPQSDPRQKQQDMFFGRSMRKRRTTSPAPSRCALVRFRRRTLRLRPRPLRHRAVPFR